jgi:uncharacterized membrane protein YbhN (UPF0104 family)
MKTTAPLRQAAPANDAGAATRVRRMHPAIRWAIAAAGATVLAYCARHLDFRAVWASMRGIDPAYGLAAALVMIVAKVGAKVMRSQRLQEDACARVGVAAPPLPLTARLLAASHAAGQLAWGPLGFTVRTFALREHGLPIATVARIHVAERIAEALGIATIAAIALALEPGAILGSLVGKLLIGVLAAVVLVAVAALLSKSVRGRLAAKALGGRALVQATGWAFASSVADACVLALAARGMHVDAGIAPILLAFLAVNGACALPMTPAQLGVQESAIVVAFATAGIAAPAALACALAYRAAHVVPLLAVGVPSLVATWAPQRRAS